MGRPYSSSGQALFVAIVLVGGLGAREAAALEVAQLGEAGFLRVDYQVQARFGMRDQGVDPTRDERTADFYVRRNRLSLIGVANETFGAVVQLELNGGQQLGDTAVLAQQRKFELVLLDAFATVDVKDYLRLRAGKTKHVLTREVQEGCFDPLSMDRSPFILGPFGRTSPEKSTRDVGVVLWGNAYDRTVQYRLAAMQGNDFGSAMPGDIGYRYTGRVHLTFFDKEAGIVYRGTYLGAKKVLTLGAGYEWQRHAVYSSQKNGPAGAEDYRAYTYDAFYEHPTRFGTFTASGAYLRTDFGEAALRDVVDAQDASGERNGFYWKAGYMLWRVQVFGRYERWSFANLNGVLGQKLYWTVAGVNYFYRGENARVTLEYSVADLKKEPGMPSVRDFRTVLLQVQAQL